jgi:hypothetical protein
VIDPFHECDATHDGLIVHEEQYYDM